MSFIGEIVPVRITWKTGGISDGSNSHSDLFPKGGIFSVIVSFRHQDDNVMQGKLNAGCIFTLTGFQKLNHPLRLRLGFSFGKKLTRVNLVANSKTCSIVSLC